MSHEGEAGVTRSVEIPEAAVEAGARVLNPNIFAKPDTEDWQDVVRGTARAVLEAAAPHLAGKEELPNGDTGTALAEWLYNRFSGRRGPDSAPWVARTAETHGYWEHEAEAVLRALPYLAPAEPAKCHRCGYELRPDDTYTLLDGTTYHLRSCPDRLPAPAVPQPVDREALVKALISAAADKKRFEDWTYIQGAAEDFADAVLAVLAGEQEQVEK